MQLLWSYDISKWAIFAKNPHFTMKNFKFWEAVKWLKMFAPNYQKAHPTPNLVEQSV